MSKPMENMLHSKVAFAWGILLGDSALPFLLPMAKAFPNSDGLFTGLLTTAGLVVCASLVGYLRSQKNRINRHLPTHEHI